MCAQIVKIYPEIEELEQQIEQEKERRREVQARVREEELKIDVLRQAAIKIRRVILHQEVGRQQGLTQSRKKTTGSETSRARRTTASEGLCTKSGCRSTPTTCSSTTTASTSSTTTDAPSPPSCAARGSAPSRPAAPRGRSSPSAGPPVALFSATPPARWRD